MVQKLILKKVPKNGPKIVPQKCSLVQVSSSPGHILLYGYFLWQTDFRIILRLLS